MSRPPSTLDLFCGAGGLALGFQQAGYSIVGGIDNFTVSVDTFNANVANGRGMARDLRQECFTDIETFLDGEHVDVVIGGPACQGFSTSGGLSRAAGRNQSDPRNRLFTNYVDLVDHLSPEWIVFENVPGLLLYNQGAVALEIIPFVPGDRLRTSANDSLGGRLRRTAIAAPTLFRWYEYWLEDSISVSNTRRLGTLEGLLTSVCSPVSHWTRDAGDSVPHVTFADACDDLPPVAEGCTIDGLPYDREPSSDYQVTMRRGSDSVRQHTAANLGNLARISHTVTAEGRSGSVGAEFLPREQVEQEQAALRPCFREARVAGTAA